MKNFAIIILTALSSCASHDVNMYSDLTSYWTAVGQQEEEKIDVLDLHFEIDEPFDQVKAKQLLVKVTQEYLQVINTDPVLKKLSPIYPVTSNDLIFALSYKNPTSNYPKYTGTILLEKGFIHYIHYDPITQSFTTYLTEPYSVNLHGSESSCGSYDAKTGPNLASYSKKAAEQKEEKIDVLNLQVELEAPFDQAKAKQLLVKATQKHLQAVNTDPILRELSPIHPVTSKDLNFALFYKSLTSNDPKYTATIFLKKDTIHYAHYDPITQNFITYLTEPYSTSLDPSE